MDAKIRGWPEFPIPDDVRSLIKRFYSLLDTESDAAAAEWSELFAPEGELIIEARDGLHVRGREGTVLLETHPNRATLMFLRIALAAERRQSWRLLQSRDHSTSKIYCHDKACTDLFVWGSNNVVMRNGVAFTQECAQHFKLLEREGKYYISLFKSFIVRTFLPLSLFEVTLFKVHTKRLGKFS